MMDRRSIMVVLPAALMCSCGPPASEGGFDSANPAAKMYAIEYAARDEDQSAVRQIVEQLDSDDPAVRSLAITALRRITGKTYGYRDYDPPADRRAAIDRWRTAVESGEVFDAAPSSTPGSSGGPSHG